MFYHLEVGDEVIRDLCGFEMTLKVTEIDFYKDLIHCGPWAFDRKTGAEIDDLLGSQPTMAISYLK